MKTYLLFRTHVKKLGMVVCAWTPSAGRVEIDRSLGLPSQEGDLHGEVNTSERPSLKRQSS